MNTANCDTENWEAEDPDLASTNPIQWALRAVTVWFRWLRLLFQRFFSKSASMQG